MRITRSMFWRMMLGLVLAWGAGASAQPYVSGEHVQTGDAARIRVLSSHNDLVTGGDALVEVSAPAGVRVTLNGRPVDAAFQRGSGGALVGVVSGLALGDNILEVSRPGATPARLTLTNWPAQGPVISGPHETPFICQTEEFTLAGTGENLGPALSADCDVPTRVDYVYRQKDGDFKALPTDGLPGDLDEIIDAAGGRHPYIVRVETGVVNRSIYQIAVLHDPRGPALSPTRPPRIWNRGLVYTFGGGCPGGMYVQGKTTGGVLEHQMLARGYAVASSTLNVFGNNCNDLLASETMMMVKERFIEHFGLPERTIGWGCSGGSYQAEQIADNYPGLLDGIVVGCSFPDVGHAAVSVHSFGAKLVYRYYKAGAKTDWTQDQIVAASGLPNYTSLEKQGDRGDRIDPTDVCPKAVSKDLLYDPKDNPRGARCSIYDHGRAGFGVDPATGFARRPLDNVGVQYGLTAFNAGAINAAQFVDLNRNIGGVDIDAKFTPERTRGDLAAIALGYRSGRFLSGGGGLASVPIIDYRAYADFDNGDPHQRFHSFSFRERLIRVNGDADNQVLLTDSSRRGLFSLNNPVLLEALDQMDAWLRALRAAPPGLTPRQRVVAAKPLALVDACFDKDGGKIAERQIWGQDTACNRLYPPHANPYIVAGAPLTNDVLKCQLKPLDPADYLKPLKPEELAQLREIFPEGVCDYAKPGVEQQPLMGRWLSFGPAGAAS